MTSPVYTTDLCGQRVGGYEIVRLIGEGGMGSVWAAVNRINGRRAAVKVMLPELLARPALVERFEQEARAASRVEHPNIARVYDVAHLPDGRLYMVMEFLEGGDLEGYIAPQSYGKLGAEQTLRIVGQIAYALESLHAEGVVHRDLKPSNVLLVQTEHQDQVVKLVDFGLAKLEVEAAGGARLTKVGVVAGSPHYMAPEQAQSFGAVDGRADIFSLGTITFRMVCGRLPFEDAGSDPLAIVMRHMEDPFRPRQILEREAQHLPAGWFEAIEHAMAYRPEARTPRVRDFALQLAAATEGGEQILRSVARELYDKAQPDDQTAKHPRDRVPTRALASPPPAAPPAQGATTHRAAAGERPASAPPTRRLGRVLIPAGIVAALAAALVITLVRGRGSDDGGDPAGVAASTAPEEVGAPAPRPPDPPAQQLPAPNALRKIRIVTEPPGAAVSIDGELVGPSPILATLADGAQVRLHADLAGHVPVDQTVKIEAATRELKLTLTPMPAITPGTASADRPEPSEPTVRRTDRRKGGRGTRTDTPPNRESTRPTEPVRPFDPDQPVGPR